jgi:hypothetical protein
MAFGREFIVYRVSSDISVLWCSLDEFQSIWVDYFEMESEDGVINN